MKQQRLVKGLGLKIIENNKPFLCDKIDRILA